MTTETDRCFNAAEQNEPQPIATDTVQRLDPIQDEAVALCLDRTKRLVGITGSAGTGKTTIMKRVYNALRDQELRVVLAAPTGKASKRITEATNIPAMTIHRLLEYSRPGERDPKTGQPYGYSYPKRDRDRPLDVNVILIDEYSMVNQEVHRALLDAVPAGAIVRVFGDVQQLTPIEEGYSTAPSPFQDILKRFPSVRLTTIHRQAEGSAIVFNGQRILNGFIPQSAPDFEIKYTHAPVDVLKDIVRATGLDYASVDNQIISPRATKCWIAAMELNAILQPMLVGSMSAAMDIPRHTWHAKYPLRLCINDKVMWTNNDYELEIFNGESGIVKDLTDAGEVVIDFGDRAVVVPPLVVYVNQHGREAMYDPRKEIQLAYVVSTHKSQGSEYKNVVYIMNKAANFMLDRHNFYTGITRARSKVIVITDQQSIAASTQRETSLMSRPKTIPTTATR